MWILEENNEKANGGKNCFSKDNLSEETPFPDTVSYSCTWAFHHFFPAGCFVLKCVLMIKQMLKLVLPKPFGFSFS